MAGDEGEGRVYKRPVLADVARLAGVSVSTASRVLRQQEQVDPALAERVHTAAEQLDYVPNLMARSLRQGSPGVVGLVVGDMLDPYFGVISESVTVEADEQGLIAVVTNMRREAEREVALCERLWEHRVSGLILAGGGFDQVKHRARLAHVVARMQRSDVTIVALSRRELDVPTFSVDDGEVGALAAQHVLAAGHTRIGVVFGPYSTPAIDGRIRGARRVLDAAGVTWRLVREPYTPAGGVAAAESLVLKAAEPVTAIIAGTDSLAIGVLRRLAEAGVPVPDEVSVIGVGNTPDAQASDPALTTVDVALSDAARQAVRYLARVIKGEPTDGALPSFQPRLVVRGSVAAVSRPPLP